ncbi:MAG: aminotransferase class V-fold PLP-dependent enzyme [Acidimicrobiia bacterium]|nr:aminotransferase class V-fold PLP-dependent enzyme [Acidimicrobiia bacterium]
MRFPSHGTPRDEVLARMRERKEADARWHEGRTFSLVYPAGPEVDEVLADAAGLYLYENALNPFRFPSLRRMEEDVVAMTADLLHAPEGFGGAMTSGGTESILLAVKVARDRARAERGVTRPRLLAPVSAHPAFAKAAAYLQLEHDQIPLGDDLRADVDAAADLLTDDTALLVGSAPGYPHGMLDPIADLAGLAAERGVAFHVDCCVGGFLLPFVERLGYELPPFDFRVPGVTSMSADVHKYGYALKGASVVLHRRRDWWFEHQVFLYDRWPGGLYGSGAMAGARPAAPIAAAWAVMTFLGEPGYLELTARLLDATRRFREGIDAIPGLHVLGDPVASVLAFGSDTLDVMAVGDVMDDRGWHLDRQHGPDALHLMVSPAHDAVVDTFLADLRDAVAHHGESRGIEARYS